MKTKNPGSSSAELPKRGTPVPAHTSSLLFSCDRPPGDKGEYSKQYGVEKLRVLLGINERIQRKILRVLERFVEGEPTGPPGAVNPRIKFRGPSDERRIAVCNQLNCLSFPEEVAEAVRKGALALSHESATTGFYMYKMYMAVKKNVSKRDKGRKSDIKLKDLVEGNGVASDEFMNSVVNEVMKRLKQRTVGLWTNYPAVYLLISQTDGQDINSADSERRFAVITKVKADRIKSIGELEKVSKDGKQLVKKLGKKLADDIALLERDGNQEVKKLAKILNAELTQVRKDLKKLHCQLASHSTTV